MKYIDSFIRIIGAISLILLLTGYSKAKGWEHIDLIGLGIWIWHEYEIRQRPKTKEEHKDIKSKDGDT